ncbi:cytochrome P450 [Gautieria morchelliformis]|nr:cytochrome P450 [Gautieria morchelliformis]
MFSPNYLALDLLALLAGALLYYFYSTTGSTCQPTSSGKRIIAGQRNTVRDIVHLSSFGSHIIILNSFSAASDLLDRRSSKYSDRQHMTMFHDLMDAGGTALLPYGKPWRKHRTFYYRQMNPSAVTVFQPCQLAAARPPLTPRLSRGLRPAYSPVSMVTYTLPQCAPDECAVLAVGASMAASVAMGIAYGRRVSRTADPLVTLSENNSIAHAQAVRPGAFLVDSFPMLKYVPAWVPGTGFQRHARKVRKHGQDLRDAPFREATGTAGPSFVKNALEDIGVEDETNEDVDLVKRVAASIFGAGSDTTTAAIHFFILAMVLHPHVQAKAQAELDSVLEQDLYQDPEAEQGREHAARLPSFDDRPHLPYVDAVVKEVLRWTPVAPTALPHVTTEDDIYAGYSIPAKSVVIPNVWRILHDPEMYPNPSVFYPERFLPDKEGNVPRDPAIAGAFGFGRRICAGSNLADNSLWIAGATILSVFDMTHAVDQHGRAIDIGFAREAKPGFFR